MKSIKKITKKDIEHVQKKLHKDLSFEARDEVFAELILRVNQLTSIIESLVGHQVSGTQLTQKEKKHIEQTLSVGPEWLKYTVTIKPKQ